MDMKYFDLFLKTPSGRFASTAMKGRTYTLEQVYAVAQNEVTKAIPFLEDGVRYKTKTLCGPAAWSKWFPLEHCVAGMCVKFWAQNELVKLYLHRTRSGKGSAQYLTQPMPQPLGRITTRVARDKASAYVLRLVR